MIDINKLCPKCMREWDQSEGAFCPHCGKQRGVDPPITHQLKPFTILQGKYIVGEVIGEGGFGITYIGYDLNLGMRLAIKEFFPNGHAMRESQTTTELTIYEGSSKEAVSRWRDSFIKEAQSLARCANLPGVVGVRDFFQENETAYIVMEYVEGETLKDYAARQGGKVDAGWLIKAMEPIMTSLSQVHSYGLIHRDISPDNIMLLGDGSMKLLDFGAAREYDGDGAKSLSVLLKPGYAPEEQYRSKGKQGPWSDVYALAGTIYKCVTGITPPESMERMRRDTLTRPNARGANLSPAAENALMKAMSVYAEDRFQTMEEFRDALMGRSGTVEVPQAPGMPQAGREAGRVASQSAGTSFEAREGASKKGLFIGLGVCAVFVVLVVSALLFARSISTTEDGMDDIQVMEDYVGTDEIEVVDTQKDSSDSPSEKEDEGASGDDDTSPEPYEEDIRVDDSAVEEYANALDYTDYEYYESDMGSPRFSFYYPVNLYHHVEHDMDGDSSVYGDGIERIEFAGTAGSTLEFSQYRRQDSRSLREETAYVHDVEAAGLIDPGDILNSVADDGHGKVIVTGWENREEGRYAIYDMCRIDGDYVLQMRVSFPDYTSDMDKAEKGYVTENYYRMCGFSDSTDAPRTFEQYLLGVN